MERLGEGKNTLAGETDGYKGNNTRRKQLAQAEVKFVRLNSCLLPLFLKICCSHQRVEISRKYCTVGSVCMKVKVRL